MVATDPLFGLDLASLSPVFLASLGVHVAAAITAIVSGLVAMLSRKGAGRHPRAGRVYFTAIWVVFASACVLSSFRWPGDMPLVAVGGVAALAATYGFAFRRLHRPGDAPHIIAMAVSYIAMLTAFYVDNGPHLPIWDALPPIAFWFVPSIVGVPLLIVALVRRRSHPRVTP